MPQKISLTKIFCSAFSLEIQNRCPFNIQILFSQDVTAMTGGVRSSLLHTTTFPTFLSSELFRLIVIDRRASWILALCSSPHRKFEGCCCGSGLCWFGSRCCFSLVCLALQFSGGCGGSARIQRFLCGLGVAMVSFRWTGGGGWRFGVAVVVLEDLWLGLCFPLSPDKIYVYLVDLYRVSVDYLEAVCKLRLYGDGG